METKDMPHGIVGLKFVLALSNGNFQEAYAFLGPELKAQYPYKRLQQEYEETMSIADPRFTEIVVVDNCRHRELDAKGWACIAISTEAVIVTVESFGNEHLITEIEWGRP